MVCHPFTKLKFGCPIILLQNIDSSNRLCNDTRLICRVFQRNIIDTEIVIGEHVGKRVFIPMISLCISDDDMFSFKMKRK
jgi:ATP-dependent DNA helicase PIF1